jgi:GDP-L-fucose synthase
MKILVTGASGFLGRNLAEFLSANFDLLMPTHKDLDLLDAQAVKKFLNRYLPEVVIHTAGVGLTREQNNTSEVTEKNLKMFYNLADCQGLFKKMIFTGSGAVYDKSRPLVKVSEDAFGQSLPKDPYGAYKYECSEYILERKDILDLRLFGVFGKYEDYKTRFISNAICKSILNLPVKIYKNVNFEYLFVEDFVKIVEWFVLHEAHYNNYNVGNGQPVSLLQIAEKIQALFNPDLEIKVLSADGGNEYSCDPSRLKNELKNFNFTSIDESLKHLYNWYSQNLSLIDKATLTQQ